MLSKERAEELQRILLLAIQYIQMKQGHLTSIVKYFKSVASIAGQAIKWIALKLKVKVKKNIISLTGYALCNMRNGDAPGAQKENINLRQLRLVLGINA